MPPSIRSGGSILNEMPGNNTDTPGNIGAVPGGNSGAVISPAPKLGLSAYQEPRNISNVKIKQGE